MNKIKHKGTILNLTHCKPDEKAKRIPAFAAKVVLASGNLSYESGQDAQGKDVARTYSTVRISEDIVVDDSHTLSRATTQFVTTGATTPVGLEQQFQAAKAHLIALCANDFAELKLRLFLNGADASSLDDASLTAIETAAVGA